MIEFLKCGKKKCLCDLECKSCGSKVVMISGVGYQLIFCSCAEEQENLKFPRYSSAERYLSGGVK